MGSGKYPTRSSRTQVKPSSLRTQVKPRSSQDIIELIKNKQKNTPSVEYNNSNIFERKNEGFPFTQGLQVIGKYYNPLTKETAYASDTSYSPKTDSGFILDKRDSSQMPTTKSNSQDFETFLRATQQNQEKMRQQ